MPPQTQSLATRVRGRAAAGLGAVARRLAPPPPRGAPAGRALAQPQPRPWVPSEPGSRVCSRFFDDHPRFYETSRTILHHDRLNLRYDAIFAENRDLFEGARVLDISSHDGRWSLAALRTGAASVVGIEARPELVANAASNLAAYGVEPDRYHFVTGDVFEVLAAQHFDVDVVMCLGFFYHTLRYNELLHLISRLGAGQVVMDTEVLGSLRSKALIEIRHERTAREGNAVADKYSGADRVLVGRPTIKALRVLMGSYGYRLDRFSDWEGLLRDNEPEEGAVDDYRDVRRVTARFSAAGRAS